MQLTPQQLEKWRNPVSDIKDPLKQRWAEIVQQMATHINGVCPMHIYYNRRPLESNNPYALWHRVINFQPTTKDAFDRAINGIVSTCLSADIKINAPDLITSNSYKIKDKDVYDFCLNDLTRVRESDPNAVVVVLPLVEDLDEELTSIKGVDIKLVRSTDIEYLGGDSIKFYGGEQEIDEKKVKYYWIIDSGQYSIEYRLKDKTQTIPVIKLPEIIPYIYISSNIVYEAGYSFRIPYLYGACAWGDKYYGKESDFTIQDIRYSYIKEIRAKEKCNEDGTITDPKLGHIYIDGGTCKKCGGSGYVKDDSPYGTTYVDYDKLTAEDRAFPQVIQYTEPPQNALLNSKMIVDTYFDRMCESLGLVKQNYTNQSAVSKEFDYKEKMTTINKIFNDDIYVLQSIYRMIEFFLSPNREMTTVVYSVGELGESTLNELIEKLSSAKQSQAPPAVVSSLVDQIYLKSLNPEYSDIIINIASSYDKLYIYGTSEITQARANFGNSITEKDIIIHNTIVSVLDKYFMDSTNDRDTDKVIAYLDSYYSKYNPTIQTISIL